MIAIAKDKYTQNQECTQNKHIFYIPQCIIKLRVLTPKRVGMHYLNYKCFQEFIAKATRNGWSTLKYVVKVIFLSIFHQCQ